MLFTDNYSDNNEDSAYKHSAFVLESDPKEEFEAVVPKRLAPPKPIVTLKISAAPAKQLKQPTVQKLEQDDYSLDQENYEEDFDQDEEEELKNFKKTAQEFQHKLKVLTELSQQPLQLKKAEMQQPDQKRTIEPKTTTYQDPFKSKSVPRIDAQALKIVIPQKVENVKRTTLPSKPTSVQQAKLVKQKSLHISLQSVKKQTEINKSLKSPSMIKSIQQKQAALDVQVQHQRQTYEHPEDRNPFAFMEVALAEAKSKIEKMKQTPQILDVIKDNEKRKQYLKAENKVLRESLKRMSENANILIEKMNIEQVKQQKSTPDKQKKVEGGVNSARGRVPTSVDDRENQNQEKAISNLLREQKRLLKRKQELSQPDYLLNLKRDLQTTEDEIKQQEKMKKRLIGEQAKHEKQLSNVLDANQVDVTAFINDTTHRLTSLTENVVQLRSENQRALDFRGQQSEQLESLKVRILKLNQIASHYGVSLEHNKIASHETKQLQEQIDLLQKQQRILVQAIDTQQKKNDAVLNEKRKELLELDSQQQQLIHSFNVKHSKLTYNAVEIRDLIEQAKESADDTLLQILVKWQHANDQLIQHKEQASLDYESIVSQTSLNDSKARIDQKSIRAQQQPHEIQEYKDQWAQQQNQMRLRAEIGTKVQLQKVSQQKHHQEEKETRGNLERQQHLQERFKQEVRKEQNQIQLEQVREHQRDLERLELEREEATNQLKAQLEKIVSDAKKQEEALKQQIAIEREERIREQQKQAEILRKLETDKETLIAEQRQERILRKQAEISVQIQEQSDFQTVHELQSPGQVPDGVEKEIDQKLIIDEPNTSIRAEKQQYEIPQLAQKIKEPPAVKSEVVHPINPPRSEPEQIKPLTFMERQKLKQQQVVQPAQEQPVQLSSVLNDVPVIDFGIRPRRVAGAPPALNNPTPKFPEFSSKPQSNFNMPTAAEEKKLEEIPVLDLGIRPRRVAGAQVTSSSRMPLGQANDNLQQKEQVPLIEIGTPLTTGEAPFVVANTHHNITSRAEPLKSSNLNAAVLLDKEEKLSKITETLDVNKPVIQETQVNIKTAAPQIRQANVQNFRSVNALKQPIIPTLDELEDY